MNSRAIDKTHNTVESINAGAFAVGLDYATNRPSGTDDWLLIFTEAGAGRVAGTGKHAEVRAGQAILYTPHSPQDYSTSRAEAHWNLLWSHFRPSPNWLGWLQWPTLVPGVKGIHLKDTHLCEQTVAALRDCVSAMRSIEPEAIAFARNALERALLLLQRGCGPILDSRIRKGIDYMAVNVEAPFRLMDLARACGLSASRTAHLFKAQTGLAPVQYMERLRLQRAASLLKATQWPVKEIATACGYPDPFYFSTRFKQHHGQSPRAYRASLFRRGYRER